MHSYDLPLRQLGGQEADIVRMASGVTKMAVVLDDPADVRRVLKRAFHQTVSGRHGPVGVDVPIDVQATPIDPDALEAYKPGPQSASATLPQPTRAADLPDGGTGA